MPLENNMVTPKNFLGACGVMNQGMSTVTIMYLLVGLLGYLKHGKNTKEIITLSLPNEDM